MKHFLLLLLLPAAHVFGDVVSYEGNSFPDDAGWERSDRMYLADRWLEDGWFVQHAEIVIPEPPHVGEDDIYTRSIAEFAGTEAFFVEWRMETDGTPDGMFAVAPAAFVAGGSTSAIYHFTIARDRVLFRGVLGDDLTSVVWADIEPSLPHVYRLETYGDRWYEWSIDGVVIDSGDPEWSYPTDRSRIVWGARAAIEDSTTRWDYIRYGTIPEPATGILMLGLALVLLHRRTP